MTLGKFKKFEITLGAIHYVPDNNARPRIVKKKKIDPIHLVVAADVKESAKIIGNVLVKKIFAFNRQITELISVEETDKSLTLDNFSQWLFIEAEKIIKARGKNVRLFYAGRKIVSFCVV